MRLTTTRAFAGRAAATACLLVAILALAAPFAGPAAAQWERVGTRQAVPLPITTFDIPDFTRADGIGIDVRDGTVYVGRVEISFRDGSTVEADIDQLIAANNQPVTVEFDRGHPTRVSIAHAAVTERRRGATLVLTIRRSNRNPQPDPGFEVLASDTLNSRWTYGSLRIGRSAGLLEGIQIGAPNGNLNIEELEFVFGNGEVQQVSIRPMLRSGTLTRVLRFNRGRRFLREVRFRGRAVGGSRARSEIEVIAVRPAAGPDVGNGGGGNTTRPPDRRPRYSWQVVHRGAGGGYSAPGSCRASGHTSGCGNIAGRQCREPGTIVAACVGYSRIDCIVECRRSGN